MKAESAKNIDEYIAAYPTDVQHLLQTIRATIHKAAPEAEEAITYGIPTFKLNGNLVHFGGYKSHIGFYPAPMGIEAFKEETAQYEAGKGTLQFPIDKPLPLELVSKIVKYRVEKNLAKVKKNKC
jgi:uncharacterized protein YdhG (YjbR/CyaY superfamily)